jgi:hypothetical protein
LGHVYVDYTGGGLFGESQVRRHAEFLTSTVLGNPHSTNPTSNASGALKLVGESYPFGDGDQFLLTYDNHNSVVGIRAFDRVGKAKTKYVPVLPPDMRITSDTLTSCLSESPDATNKLFAYPAQSNFSGVQHSLEWIEEAQTMGWDVLLDAAAFVPTNRLDLSRWHPDYVTLSFYKMFGYPTGVGAPSRSCIAPGSLGAPSPGPPSWPKAIPSLRARRASKTVPSTTPASPRWRLAWTFWIQ